MDHRLSQRIVQKQSLQQKQIISPKMILANKLLQLGATDLQQEVARELNENPALEVGEGYACPRCQSRMVSATCYACGFSDFGDKKESMDLIEMGRLLTLARSVQEPGAARRAMEEDQTGSVLDGAAKSRPSLSDQMLSQFWLLTDDPAMSQAAEEVVLFLDDRGFLIDPVNRIAELTEFPAEVIQGVVDLLKTIPPYGIGSMTAREALLTQLAHKNPPEPLNSRLKDLLENHFEAMGKDPDKTLLKTMGLPPSEAKQTRDWLKKELFPYPAYLLGTQEDLEAQRRATVEPNVIVRLDKNKFICEMAGNSWSHLRINKDYERLYKKMKDGVLKEEEKEHVRQYFNRARQFMDALNQRERTILRITRKLTEIQRDFLFFGYKSLKPLTRVEMARELELHEATISRATAGKYVAIPSGEVLSYDIFFDASLGPKEYIRDLIANENPLKPYSDQELMGLLKQKGVDLARRTVAKYREEMQILPGFLRKRA